MKRIYLLAALVLLAAGCRPADKADTGGDAQALAKPKYEILVLVSPLFVINPVLLYCSSGLPDMYVIIVHNRQLFHN